MMKKFLKNFIDDLIMWKEYFFTDDKRACEQFSRSNLQHLRNLNSVRIAQFEIKLLELKRDQLNLQLRLSAYVDPRTSPIYIDLIKNQAEIDNLEELIAQFKSFA
jgi:hypothetical protein